MHVLRTATILYANEARKGTNQNILLFKKKKRVRDVKTKNKYK